MQWYIILFILALIFWVLNVQNVLIFSFTSIITYIVTQNLLGNNIELDITHFFTNSGQYGSSKKTSSFPRKLLSCKQTLIKYILRDFVISWFENVGSGEKFVVEVQSVLEEAADIFCARLQCANVPRITSDLCSSLHQHLIAFQTTQNTEIFSNISVRLQNYQSFKKRKLIQRTEEIEYLRTIVDLLLQKLIKNQTLGCKTGRFILREILAVSLLLPVIDKLCEPHFINTSIINIFGESTVVSEEDDVDDLSVPFFDCISEDTTEHIDTSSDVEFSTEYRFKNSKVIENEYKEIVDISLASCATSGESNTVLEMEGNLIETRKITIDKETGFCEDTEKLSTKKVDSISCEQCNKRQKETKDNDKESSFNPLGLFNVKLPSGGFMLGKNFGKRIIAPALIKVQFGLRDEHKSKGEDSSETKTTKLSDNSDVLSDGSDDEGRMVATGDQRYENGSVSSSFINIDYPSDVNLIESDDIFCEESSNDKIFDNSTSRMRHYSSSSEDWDEGMFGIPEQDSKNLNIPITCQNDEQDVYQLLDNDNPCLLINIPTTELVIDTTWEPHKRKYTVYHIKYSNKLWNTVDKTDEIILIKRRYREFMELHHRLSNGPYTCCLKDVPKPNRRFNSPFFRLDEDVIEGRQHLLETYLKGLVTHSNILNCNAFKGFLGIGNESQTTFRRQIIPVPTVPRIDKKLHKKMSKIIDHIKTAFDTGPIEGDLEDEFDEMSDVYGGDKMVQDDIRTFAICSNGCKVSHNCCSAQKCFNLFIQDKMKSGPEFDQTSVPTQMRGESGKHRDSISGVKDANNSSFHLAQSIFNLTCELFEESWVCLDPVQEATTTTFGCLFEWWFERLVVDLVSEEQWQFYLTTLKQTVWPHGRLMDHYTDDVSNEEKTRIKTEAIDTLSHFFGAILHMIIGTDAIKTSAQSIINSLQNKEINRQLLFEILEILLVEIFPEIVNEDQDSN